MKLINLFDLTLFNREWTTCKF